MPNTIDALNELEALDHPDHSQPHSQPPIKPKWSPADSSVIYTAEEVQALTPIRKTVEQMVADPELAPSVLDAIDRQWESPAATTTTVPVQAPLTPATDPPTPAAPRSTTVPARRNTRANKYVDDLTNQYIESMGSRADLTRALSRANSAKAQRFLAMLADPNRRAQSITRIARLAGIESVDLYDMFREHYHAEAMMTVVQGLPTFAADLVEDSKSVVVECARCDGVGKVVVDMLDLDPSERPAQVECPRCHGSGQQRKPGDADARKLIAKTVGWDKGGTGAGNVVVNIRNHNTTSVIDEVERMVPNPVSRQRMVASGSGGSSGESDGVIDAEMVD